MARGRFGRALKIVRIPTPVRVPVVSRGRRLRGLARRGVSAVANRAREERHTLTAVATATGFGMLEKYAPQALDALSIGPLGPTATLGLGAWFANRWFKSRVLEHVATGLLCVAGYNLAKTGFTASEGDWIGE